MKIHEISSTTAPKFKTPDLSLELIISTIREACDKVIKAELYPKTILEEIKQYQIENSMENNIHKNSLLMLMKELRETIDFRNTEKFYVTFYANIVTISEFYAPSLKKTTSQIVLRKFSDILLASTNEEQELDTSSTKNISPKQVSNSFLIDKIFYYRMV